MAAASPLEAIKAFQAKHVHYDCLGKEVNTFFEKISADLADGSADYLAWSVKSRDLLESTKFLLKNFQALVGTSTRSNRGVPSSSAYTLVSIADTKNIAEAMVEFLIQLTQDLKRLEHTSSMPELGATIKKTAQSAASASQPDASAMEIKVRLFPTKPAAASENKPPKKSLMP